MVMLLMMISYLIIASGYVDAHPAALPSNLVLMNNHPPSVSELGDLKRHPILAQKYGPWCVALAQTYGSTGISLFILFTIHPKMITNFVPCVEIPERYLVEHRLPWKTPPTHYGHSTPSYTHGVDQPYPTPPSSATPSYSSSPALPPALGPKVSYGPSVNVIPMESLSNDYLKFEQGDEFDEENYAVLPNDWPYNVPKGVEHCIVWSKVRSSLFHPVISFSNLIINPNILRTSFQYFTRL